MAAGRFGAVQRRLLVELCLGTFDPAALGGVDLVPVLGRAAELRVESFVLHRLGPLQQTLGPEARLGLSRLRQRVQRSAAANLEIDDRILELLARLRRRRIPAMVLKGTALRRLESGLAGRFQTDVDLLVRPSDLAGAEAELAASGYLFAGDSLDRDVYRRHHFHFPYRGDGVLLELHWDLDRETPPGFVDRVWRRSRVVGSDGEPWRLPAAEHQLLLACLHLSRHAFIDGLRWLADLPLLLPLDEAVARRFEQEAGLWPARAVFCPLWLLARRGLGGASLGAGPGAVPAAVGTGRTPRTVAAESVEIYRGLLQVGRLQARILDGLLVDHLTGVRWIGVERWRTEAAVRDWLYSRRSLTRVFVSGLRRAVEQRLGAAGGQARTQR